MSEAGFSRRNFLGTLAAASAATWLSASWSDLRAAGLSAAAAAPEDAWLVLKPEQVRELDAVTAQLIPTDDMPGAREARVVRFIDKSLATYAKSERAGFEAALKKLNDLVASHFPGATSFAALGDAEQLTVLRDWEATDGQTFGRVHYAAIAGMFSNPEYGGNYNKAGWKVLGFKDQFIWAPPFGYYDRA